MWFRSRNHAIGLRRATKGRAVRLMAWPRPQEGQKGHVQDMRHEPQGGRRATRDHAIGLVHGQKGHGMSLRVVMGLSGWSGGALLQPQHVQNRRAIRLSMVRKDSALPSGWLRSYQGPGYERMHDGSKRHGISTHMVIRATRNHGNSWSWSREAWHEPQGGRTAIRDHGNSFVMVKRSML